jgi:hypothetical protein
VTVLKPFALNLFEAREIRIVHDRERILIILELSGSAFNRFRSGPSAVDI